MLAKERPDGTLVCTGTAPTRLEQGIEELGFIKEMLKLVEDVYEIVCSDFEAQSEIVRNETNSLTSGELRGLEKMVYEDVDRSKVHQSRQRPSSSSK